MVAMEMIDTLLGMDDERRKEILALMAGSDSAKLEALEKDVEGARVSRAKAIKRAEEDKVAKLRKEAIDAFTVRVQAWDGSEEDSMPELWDLLDEAISLKGHIVLDGFQDSEDGSLIPTFSVTGFVTKKSGGGNGKGRPKATTPTDFVDSDGNRIFGAITDFARENVPQEVLDADYLKDVDDDFDTEKKKVPFKKAGAALAEQLVEDNYLVASEYVAETEAETEISEVSDDSDSDNGEESAETTEEVTSDAE